MLDRQHYQQQEADRLAPCAMRSAQSRGRKTPENEHPLRSVYQRDRDRVIHCQAFRRLMYKTQVFVNHEGDYFRTRLTHTIEVSQIARTVARILNLNEDLTEAAALVHDVGHTPFGHAGEETLDKLMAGHGGFEHNRHGLRVVDVLEKPYPDFDGLNLTWELREAIAKHTTRHDKPAPGEFDDGLQPVLEGQIVELADSIAYDSHDLDDAIRSGVLEPADVQQTAIWQRAVEAAGRSYPDQLRHDKDMLTRQVVRFLINLMVTDLVEQTAANLEAANIDSVEAVRNAPGRLLSFSEGLERDRHDFEQFLYDRVYKHHRVMRMTLKAQRLMTDLFEAYVEHPEQLPPNTAAGIVDEATKYQAVCDYVAGMTDRFAQDEWKKLFLPFERV